MAWLRNQNSLYMNLWKPAVLPESPIASEHTHGRFKSQMREWGNINFAYCFLGGRFFAA